MNTLNLWSDCSYGCASSSCEWETRTHTLSFPPAVICNGREVNKEAWWGDVGASITKKERETRRQQIKIRRVLRGRARERVNEREKDAAGEGRKGAEREREGWERDGVSDRERGEGGCGERDRMSFAHRGLTAESQTWPWLRYTPLFPSCWEQHQHQNMFGK